MKLALRILWFISALFAPSPLESDTLKLRRELENHEAQDWKGRKNHD